MYDARTQVRRNISVTSSSGASFERTVLSLQNLYIHVDDAMQKTHTTTGTVGPCTTDTSICTKTSRPRASYCCNWWGNLSRSRTSFCETSLWTWCWCADADHALLRNSTSERTSRMLHSYCVWVHVAVRVCLYLYLNNPTSFITQQKQYRSLTTLLEGVSLLRWCRNTFKSVPLLVSGLSWGGGTSASIGIACRDLERFACVRNMSL